MASLNADSLIVPRYGLWSTGDSITAGGERREKGEEMASEKWARVRGAARGFITRFVEERRFKRSYLSLVMDKKLDFGKILG
jgi:hypothetical protein